MRSHNDNPKAYQINVTLKGIQPPIWRRIRVRGDTTLDQLHRILQRVMGWTDIHPHHFLIGNACFGERGRTILRRTRNEQGVRLDQVITGEGAKFLYEYDFGNNWEHELLIEKVCSSDQTRHCPACLAGERACPPEDCGGALGYELLLKMAKTPNEPEYREAVDWLDEEFNPEAFEVKAANCKLHDID